MVTYLEQLPGTSWHVVGSAEPQILAAGAFVTVGSIAVWVFLAELHVPRPLSFVGSNSLAAVENAGVLCMRRFKRHCYANSEV